MGKEISEILLLLMRYLALIILGINLHFFYIIFTPLTIYPVYFFLTLFFPVSLSGITLTIKDFTIQLVPACIAGSAYYLLLILNLSTPLSLKKRFLSLIFSSSTLLIINIIRILFFSFLLLNFLSLFNFLHLIFWYFLSGIFVFLIWLAEIKIFNIKEVPIYSDMRFLFEGIKARR